MLIVPPLLLDPAGDVGSVRSWHGFPPGPAGLVSVTPAAGVLLAYDAADLSRPVELQLDFDAADPAAVTAVAGSALGADSQVWTVASSSASWAVQTPLARRALLEGLDSAHPLALVDAVLTDLDLPAGLRSDADVAAAGAALLDTPTSGLTPEVLEDLGAAAWRLAGALDGAAPAGALERFADGMAAEATRRAEPVPLRAVSSLMQAPSPPPMAAAAPARAMAAPARRAARRPRMETVPALVDPRVAHAAGIEQGSVTAVRYDRSGPVVVQARVGDRLGTVWARLWERGGDSAVALGRLRWEGTARVDLPLPPGVPVERLELDLVDDPRSPRVTERDVRLAEAWRAGWAALTVDRVRGAASARRWWLDASSAWAAAGDPDRSALASGYAGEAARDLTGVTWARLLVGQPRRDSPPFLFERVSPPQARWW